MRNPNDVKLAENVDEIDLILGGHDHVYEVNKVSKCRDVFYRMFY
jgi:5'-nucleotidase